MLAGSVLQPYAGWVVCALISCLGCLEFCTSKLRNGKLLPCPQLLQKSKSPSGPGNLCAA